MRMVMQKGMMLGLALAMALTARADVFQGRVVDAKDQPVANAEVLVQSSQKDQPEFAYSTLHTDAQGGFSATLSPSPYSDLFFGRIYAVAPGMAPGCVAITTANKYKETIIQLLPAETISGRVIDQQGKPVTNAAVQLESISIKSTFPNVYLYGMPWAKRFEAVTDKNGHWQISGVPSGMKASLSIEDPRFVKAQWEAFSGAPSTTKVRPGAILTGRVVDEKGNPVSDVLVLAGNQNIDKPGGGHASTAADGSYRITGLAAGTYDISARTSKKELVTSGITNQKAQEGETGTVPDVVMIPGAVITGRVINQKTGKPAVGVSVNGNDAYDSTGADGHYALRVPPGNVHVAASAPGQFVPSDKNAVDLTAQDGQTITHNFALDPGATASGIVVDRQGKPVTGAQVEMGPPSGFYMLGGSSDITDAKGRWTMQGLEPGEMNVRVSSPWVNVEPIKVTLPQSGDIRVVAEKISDLPPFGRVVGIDQKSLAGVILQLSYVASDDNTGSSMHSYASVISDSKGYLHFFPPPGTTSIIVTQVNSRDYILSNVGKWDAKTRRLGDIVLDRLNKVVRGRVLDERGKPASNIRVQAAGFEKAVTQTDKSGNYVLSGLPHQPVTVLAVGKSTVASAIAGDADAELRLRPLHHEFPSREQCLEMLADLWRGTTDKTFDWRPQVIHEIASYDAARALALLKNADGKIPAAQLNSLAFVLPELKQQEARKALNDVDGKISNSDVYRTIAIVAEKFPSLALQWGSAHLDDLTQDDDRVQVLCYLAKLAAGRDDALAQKYFSQAAALAQIFPAPQEKTYSSDESLESPMGKFLCTRIFMAGAAAKVHPSQTHQWMEQIFPYAVDPHRGSRSDYDWARDLMAQELAVSAPQEVESLVQHSIGRMQTMELHSAVRSALYRKDIAAAQRWVDQLTAMYRENKQPATATYSRYLMWDLGGASREMIDAVGPKDPARAMRLARLVNDNAQTGRSLMLAGQYQSKTIRLKVWNEAFSLLENASQSGELTAVLARKIEELDPARGKVLLDRLLQANAHPEQNVSYMGKLQASDLAAAIAHYQPITSWQLLQNSWAAAIKNPQAQWADYVDLAVAMSAVDFDQSMQWARHISAKMGAWKSTTSYPASHYAQYKIIQKTLATSKNQPMSSRDVF